MTQSRLLIDDERDRLGKHFTYLRHEADLSWTEISQLAGEEKGWADSARKHAFKRVTYAQFLAIDRAVMDIKRKASDPNHKSHTNSGRPKSITTEQLQEMILWVKILREEHHIEKEEIAANSGYSSWKGMYQALYTKCATKIDKYDALKAYTEAIVDAAIAVGVSTDGLPDHDELEREIAAAAEKVNSSKEFTMNVPSDTGHGSVVVKFTPIEDERILETPEKHENDADAAFFAQVRRLKVEMDNLDKLRQDVSPYLHSGADLICSVIKDARDMLFNSPNQTVTT